MDTKQCLICAEHKALDAFSRLKTGRSGIHPWCRECLRQYFRDRRGDYPVRKRAPAMSKAKTAEEWPARKNRPGIYKVFCALENHTYIGASKDVEKRLRVHKAMLVSGRHTNSALQGVFNKHGVDAFEFCVLVFCEMEELELLERELFERSTPGARYFPGGLRIRPE